VCASKRESERVCVRERERESGKVMGIVDHACRPIRERPRLPRERDRQTERHGRERRREGSEEV